MTGRKDDEKRQQDYITKKLFERHHGATKSLILKPLTVSYTHLTLPTIRLV